MFGLELSDLDKGFSLPVDELLLHLGEEGLELQLHLLEVAELNPDNQLPKELSVVALLFVEEDQVQGIEQLNGQVELQNALHFFQLSLILEVLLRNLHIRVLDQVVDLSFLDVVLQHVVLDLGVQHVLIHFLPEFLR